MHPLTEETTKLINKLDEIGTEIREVMEMCKYDFDTWLDTSYEYSRICRIMGKAFKRQQRRLNKKI